MTRQFQLGFRKPGVDVQIWVGCTTEKIEGADYFNCAGTYYRAAFHSNNIVYVVSEPAAGPK